LTVRLYDAAVMGGGPAGLTAALYLARYHLSVFVADAGQSRAALIPMTHNQPFWPDGISGVALLDRMWEHVSRYAVDFHRGAVVSLDREAEGFKITTDGATIHAKTVILATGVESTRPAMIDQDHAAALGRGLLRYCPICDGYEVTDKAVAVVGSGDRLFGEAKFLRSYTSAVTAFSESGSVSLTDEQRAELVQIGVEIIDHPVSGYNVMDGLDVRLKERVRRFDTMYAALGSVIRSDLAVGLDARTTGEGCLVVDAHQRTSVQGLYAAGDVVVGVDQIGPAVGQAIVAATTLRNDLCEQSALLRKERGA
jgi:thioredoxin reductase (NADPH)